MGRRDFIRAGCVFACAWTSNLVQAHTPFNQWVVYRRKHLLIGCHKQDLQTYSLAQQLVSILDVNLPAAKARIARAPTTGRLASLLGTDQLDVALLGYQDAVSMAAGKESFKPYGKIELKTLFLLPDYVLVGRAEIPSKHAWLIAHAMAGSALDNSDNNKDTRPPLPWHHGASVFHNGEPVPES